MTSSDGFYPGEIPEAVRATIPNFRVPTMINKNYTPDQLDQDIQDADVVCPRNHNWSLEDETNTMRVLSADRCPTYGSCVRCFRSGPYGRLCNICNKDNVTLKKDGLHYVILQKSRPGKSAVLDSITLSKIFRAGHETAKADREVRWLRTPMKPYTSDMLDDYLFRVFKQELGDNRANRAERARIIYEVTLMTDFED